MKYRPNAMFTECKACKYYLQSDDGPDTDLCSFEWNERDIDDDGDIILINGWCPGFTERI